MNGDNYRHVALAMCLAIVMYVATGALSIIQQFLSMISVFLLTLLGRAILLVGHAATRDVPRIRQTVGEEREPYTDSEEDRVTMSEASLESKHSSRTRSITVKTSHSIQKSSVSV